MITVNQIRGSLFPILGLMAIVLMLAGCSSAITVTYDYDKKADFTGYRTYTFAEDLNSLPLNKFDKEKILHAIDNEMSLRGYASFYTERTDTIDLLVDVQTKKNIVSRATVLAANTDKVYTPWGYGFGPDFTSSKFDLKAYNDGALFINIIDTRQKKIIWQGRSSKALDDHLTPDVREANINYAVGMIFRYYPVQSSR